MTEFTEFVRCHRPMLLSLCIRRCRGAQDAEDLVQETLTRAWNQFEQVSGLHPNAQRAWLVRTVTHLFIDLCRRRNKEELLPDPTLQDAAALHPQPESAARWQSVSPEQFRRAVDRLPHFLAEPFRMRVAGHSYKQIATALEASDGTVSSWLFQARKQLREILMSEEQEVHP
jgi:RNA polymerase sigma-70 factor (ECF subfamily)